MTPPAGSHGRGDGGRGRSGRRRGDGPVPIGALLGDVASKLGAGRADIVGSVFVRWQEIVGASVAAHVRPLRMEGATLVVSADHPAWATQIRALAPDILRRLGEVCGDETVPERLDVRVRR